jgi:hypothetical protein
MYRPVKPGALWVLTLLMLYPGLTMAFQGGYPFLTGEWFTLKNDLGSWITWGKGIGVDPQITSALKLLVGLAWLGGVPGIWAGSPLAYHLTAFAATLTLLHDPPKGAILGAAGLAALILGRQKNDETVLT